MADVRKHLPTIASRVLISMMLLMLLPGCRQASSSSSSSKEPAAAAAQPQADAEVLQSNAGSYVVSYTAKPDPLPVGELCDLEVQVTRGDGASIATDDIVLFADAAMPHHGHGMNVVPEITNQGDGRFYVDGMLFHMPGRWELYFDITENGVTERAQCVVFFE